MVAGLERVTSGDIWIDRKRVTEMEPKDRGIAMVFQNYALYPHMSVEEKMATPEGASDMTLYEQHQKLKQQLDRTVEEWEKVSIELEELKQ